MAREVDLNSLQGNDAHLALRPLIDALRQKKKIIVIAGAGISASAGSE
jgi:NAD-dependent SIR2 family protein deacetylase